MSDRDEWQPISTAPGGVEVLVWEPGNSGGYAVVACCDKGGAWEECFSGYAIAPTYWRPLPPPPGDASEGR